MWEDGIWSFWQGLGFADIHDPLTGLLALDLHSATYFQPPKTLVSYPTRVHFRVGHLSTHSCSKSPKPVKIAYPCFYVYHLNRPSSFIPLSPSDTPYAPTTLNSKQHFPPTPPPHDRKPSHAHYVLAPRNISSTYNAHLLLWLSRVWVYVWGKCSNNWEIPGLFVLFAEMTCVSLNLPWFCHFVKSGSG